MNYPWHKAPWQAFTGLMRSQRLPHALLLTGPAGMGKLDLARRMAAAIMCQTPEDETPCGHCHSCQLFAAGHHPDYRLISPAEDGKQIKIEQIRELKAVQALTPAVADWKTVIISPAESMNISSSNSLLKLLEEPQKNTVILLIASRWEDLPITILSRCQRIVLAPPAHQETIQWLSQQHDITTDPQELEKVVMLASGAPLKSLALLQTGIIEQIRQLEADFKLLLQGQGNPVLLAQKWQQWELEYVFRYLQSLLETLIMYHLDKGTAVQIKRDWHIYDCIMAAIKLLSSSNNINKILLIEQFIVSVMDINWHHNHHIGLRA